MKFEDYLLEQNYISEESADNSGSSGSDDPSKDLLLAGRIATKLKMIPRLKVDPERTSGSQTSVTFRKLKLLQPSNMVVVLKSEVISLRIPGASKAKNIFSYDIFKIICNGDVYVPSYLHGKLEKGSKIGTVDEYLALITNTQTPTQEPLDTSTDE